MARKAKVEKKEAASLAEQLSPYAVAPGAVVDPIADAISTVIECVDNSVALSMASTAVRTDLHCKSIVDGFDVDELEAAAATFIVDRHIDQQARDLHFGILAGDRQLVETKKQLARYYASLPKKKGDEEFERKVAGRISWLTRMNLQQAYRNALFEMVKTTYRALTGMEWVAPSAEKEQDTSKLTVSEAAKGLLD